MSQTGQKGKKKQLATKNVLETLTSLGSQTVDTIKNEVQATGDEIFQQLLGQQKILQEKRNGDLNEGRAVEIDDVISGREEQRRKYNEQIFFERRLFNQENESTSKKLQETRIRLQNLMTEANRMAASASTLAENVKTAVLQNPVAANEYQINFFEDIITLITSFRKKIDSAVTWIQSVSKRAEKKNYWNMYKKKGASFLLSGESYSQRSAG